MLCAYVAIILPAVQDLAEKLYSTQSVKESARFQKPKLSQTAFTIQHYAGPVTYQTENFLDKNKDFVVAEHQQLLEASSIPFIQQLFAAEVVSAVGNCFACLTVHSALCASMRCA